MKSSLRQRNNLLTVSIVLVALIGGAILSNGIRGAKAKQTAAPATLSAIPTTTCTPAPSGLVSWWPGDGNANDIKSGHNGSLQNGATFASGQAGQAFSFDGVDDYVTTSDSSNYDFGPGDFAVDMWINTTTPSNTMQVISAGSQVDGANNQWTISYGANAGWGPGNHLDFAYFNGSTYTDSVSNQVTIIPSNWHHIAVVRSGSTLTFYFDGVAAGTGNIGAAVINSGSTGLIIGARYDSSPSTIIEHVTGLMDEVDIFSNALTATDIQNFYNAGSAGKCRTCTSPPSGLVSWWPGEGNTNDIQSGNNGTLEGSTTFAAGKIGQAFSFNPATNDDVRIPNSTALQPKSFTMDAWVNFNSTVGGGCCNSIFGKALGTDHSDSYGMWYQASALHGLTCADGGFGSCAVLDYPFTPNLGEWYHLAYSYDKTNHLHTLYVNGQPVAQAANNTVIGYDTNDLLIGADADSSGPLRFDGKIDEVELFDHALSNADVLAIYNSDAAGKCQTPSVAISDTSVSPGTNGTTNAVFNVSVSRANASQITVDYATADGSATQPSDYASTSGTLTIPANTSSATISVPVNGLTRSSAKKFTVTLSNPSNAVINRSPATCTILTGDLTKDYSINANPNGSWSYGYATDTAAGSAFNLDDLTGDGTSSGNPDLEWWYPSTLGCGDRTPGVYHSKSSSNVNFGANILPADMLALHPGCNGPTPKYSVVRWTAPITGTYVLRGRFQGIDTSGTTTDVHIIKNLSSTATHLLDGNINGYANELPFVVEVSANAGDTFDFMVGPGNNGYADDTTALKAEFTAGNLTCTSPPSGLVSWWPGDGDATDFKGVNNGTFQNGATANATGEVGQAFNLVAANSQYVSINDDNSLHPSNFTIDAWVNFNAADGVRVIFGKGLFGGNANSYVLYYYNGALRGATCDGADYSSTCTEVAYPWTPAFGVWHHVAYTYDGSTHKLYVNGREAATGANTRALVYDNTEVRIGADVDTGGLFPFDGKIDEVEFFNRAVSASEVASIFNAGSAGKCKVIPTGISAVSGTGNYGGTATLAATLGANNQPYPGQTVSFMLNNVAICDVAGKPACPTTDGSGIATLTGVDLSGINAGSYPNAVVASFAGNATYAASTGSGTLTLNKKNQTITVNTNAPASAAYNSQFTVAATSDSNLAVSYSHSGSCTNTGAPFTMTSGTGTCTVRYDQAGDNNYNAANQVTETVNAQKINQTITVNTHAPANALYNSEFTVAATSDSNLAVSYSSSGSCTNSGALLTMTAGTGSCTVKYDQGGDSNYNAANQITETVNAQKATLTITANDKTREYRASDPTFTYTPGGFVNGDTASVLSGAPDLTTTAIGTSNVGPYPINGAAGTLSAANYSFSFVAGTLTITKATPSISWNNPADIVYGTTLSGTQLNATATNPNDNSSVTGTFTYTPASGTQLNAGNNQTLHVDLAPADATNYNAASKDVSVNVQKADQTINVGTHAPANKIYNTSFGVTATSDSALAVTFSSSGVCTNSGATFTMTSGTGTCTVQYDQAGDSNYNAATQVTESVTAQKADQAIALGAIPDMTFGNADFGIGATASSNLAVSFGITGQCTLSSLTVHITAPGSCTVTASQAGDTNYNAAPSVPRAFNIAKAPATVTLSNLTHSADGNPKFATATTNPAGLNVAITYSQGGSPVAAPTNVGSYDVLATINEVNYQGSATGTLVINNKITPAINWNNPADITFGAALSANELSATASNPNDNSTVPGTFTYAPPLNTALGAGNGQPLHVDFTPTDGSTFNTAAKSVVINVLKANQTINFASLPGKTFGDADFNVSGTSSSGLIVSFAASGQCTISGNTVHITAAGSCTITASQGGNGNYSAASDVPRVFTIAKATQTITFGALAGKTLGDNDFNVGATSSSGLVVSFGASGQCTINLTTVHLNGGGSCTITASQTGNSNFNAAANVPQLFSIAKANQTITFGALANKAVNDPDFNVSASASSGLAVGVAAGGQCTVSGNTVHLTGTGSCTITASQDGDSNFNAAAKVPQTFSISKLDQTITFDALGTRTFGDADFSVSATASSGLAVSFAATGQCIINLTTVHLNGAGSCIITASQPGDSTRNAAPNVQQSFVIAKRTQTISFGALSGRIFGDAPFGLSATASSSLAVSFSILSGPATISGNTVTIIGAGTVTVRASQAGDSNYNAAANVDQSFVVARKNQTITFDPLIGRTVGDPPFPVSAIASSGLAVSFNIVSGPATITGNAITVNGAGTVTVRATQAGDNNFNAAPNVDQPFDVTVTTLSFKPQNAFGLGSQPRGVVTADVNGDGKPDLVTVNADGNSNTVTVLPGNGLGAFSAGVNYSVGPVNTQPVAVAVGDLNGDGKPDIATGNFGSGNISLLFNNGSGGFGGLQNLAIGAVANNLTMGSLKMADFNGDGKLDLVAGSAPIRVFLGNGNGTFQSPTSITATSDLVAPLTVGDFNGDGKLDIAKLASNSAIFICLGDGTGKFTATLVLRGQNAPPAAVIAAADLNGDGRLDLVLGNQNQGTTVNNLSVMIGKGDGTFKPLVNYNANWSKDIAIGDLNGDGRPDVVTTGGSFNVDVLLGNGDGTLKPFFSLPLISAQQLQSPQAVTLGDFNRNGVPDIATATQDVNSIGSAVVFLDNLPPAQTPAGTGVTVQEGAVKLNFNGVNTAGKTTSTPIDPNTAGTLPGGFSIGGASLAFEVTTTAAYTAPITLCFNVPPVSGQTAAQFNALKVLHGEAGKLIDRTISHDFAARAICASVDSLSPFLLASDANAPATNESDDPSKFVRQHYLDFFEREPDSSGQGFWVSTITSCGANQSCIEVKRINASAAFILSIEFQQEGYLVERTYKTAYGDDTGSSTLSGAHQMPVPIVRFKQFLEDTAEVGQGVVVNQGNWQKQLDDNKNAFMLDFVQRTGFIDAYSNSLTPAEFVNKLFTNAGVTPSAPDLATAVGRFGGAANSTDVSARAKALRDVTENSALITAEMNRAFVLMQYFGYLRRNPNEGPEIDYTGYDFWLRKLNQFNGNFIDAEMVKAFITSGEYRRRFGP